MAFHGKNDGNEKGTYRSLCSPEMQVKMALKDKISTHTKGKIIPIRLMNYSLHLLEILERQTRPGRRRKIRRVK